MPLPSGATRMRDSVSGTCLTQTTVFNVFISGGKRHAPMRRAWAPPLKPRIARRSPSERRAHLSSDGSSSLEPLEDEGAVGAAEAEGIGQGVLEADPPRLVGDEVEVAVGVGVLVVDGGRQHLVAQGQ